MSGAVDVAIIGAGPYGLSIAAHLRAARIGFRIFGQPMATWRTRMPAGMSLKSEGFASCLYAPGDGYTLAEYCAENGVPYAPVGLPVALEIFAAYGEAFQKRFVPMLEPQDVVSVARAGDRFRLQLADGSSLEARRVVVAAGIGGFAHMPEMLRGFSSDVVSHSADHADVGRFARQDVTVIGGGASALDLAGLLAGVGAQVRLVARTKRVVFQDPPQEPRSLRRRLRAPRSGLGTGWKSKIYSDFPMLFRHLPGRLRQDIVRHHLGPAPCWFVREQVEDRVAMLLGTSIVSAVSYGGGMQLQLTGPVAKIETGHVIAATGFRVDLSRLGFLDAGLLGAIRCHDGSPVLSGSFESAVPGLHFVGAAAAPTFGPLLRFACGAEFTAARIAKVFS